MMLSVVMLALFSVGNRTLVLAGNPVPNLPSKSPCALKYQGASLEKSGGRYQEKYKSWVCFYDGALIRLEDCQKKNGTVSGVFCDIDQGPNISYHIRLDPDSLNCPKEFAPGYGKLTSSNVEHDAGRKTCDYSGEISEQQCKSLGGNLMPEWKQCLAFDATYGSAVSRQINVVVSNNSKDGVICPPRKFGSPLESGPDFRKVDFWQRSLYVCVYGGTVSDAECPGEVKGKWCEVPSDNYVWQDKMLFVIRSVSAGGLSDRSRKESSATGVNRQPADDAMKSSGGR